MGKKIAIAATLVVLAVAAFVLAQPLLTVKAIQQGLETQDQIVLEQRIDFPQVREGLKGQLSDVLDAQLKAQAANNPFAMLGAAFVGKMADGIVDKMVTPKGLVELLSVKSEQNKPSTSPKPEAQEDQPQVEEPKQTLTEAKYRLVDSSLIELTLPAKEDAQPIKAHLTREGIKWRLTKIIAPTDKLMP